MRVRTPGKRLTLWLLSAAVVVPALLGMARPVSAQFSIDTVDDIRYQYVINGRNLVLRGYIRGQNCGSGSPEGPAVVEFGTIDGTNFGPTAYDYSCMQGEGGTADGRGQEVRETADWFNLRIGENAGRARVLGSDWPNDTLITVEHPDRVAAWRQCLNSDVSSNLADCVELVEAQLIADRTGGGGLNPGDDNITCETTGNPMTWFLCPIFNGVADAADWMFRSFIVPYLVTQPIETNTNDPNFQVWSSIRVYGNIILALAVLVLIFGRTVGGGVLDAYTAKKMAPKILAGAVGINTSIYVVNALIDATNIMGAGVGELLLSPLRASDQLTFPPSAGQGLSIVFWSGFLGIFLGGATIVGIMSGFLNAGAFASKAAAFFLFAIVIPVVLAIIGIFVTLVLRKGIILLLVISSPVAFALYCIPGTERYFKKWWDLLFGTLIAYPFIIAIFAVSDLLAVAVLNAGGITADQGLAAQITESTITNPLAAVTAFVLQFAGLLGVPFAFRFALKSVGAIYTAVTNGAKKINSTLDSRREQARKDVRRQMVTGRGRAYSWLGQRADAQEGERFGSVRRAGLLFLRNRAGGHNIHAEMAAQNAEAFKEAEAQKDTGIDDELRALSVNKQWAIDNDNGSEQHVRTRNGRRQFKTLGGAWVDEASVDAAHERWDGDQQTLQWVLGYEMSKASTQEQQDYLGNNVARINGEGSGFNMSEGEFGGMWKGAAFAKQNTDRQWKHHSLRNGRLYMNAPSMFQEIDERQGSWQMTAQHAETWTTMSQEIQRAREVLSTGVAQGEMDEGAAREVMQRGARIARSIGSGGTYRDPETGQVYGIGQGAGGRTKEEMENYAALFDLDRDYQREIGLETRDTGQRSGANWQQRHGPPPPSVVPPGPPAPGTVIPGRFGGSEPRPPTPGVGGGPLRPAA